MCHHVANKNIGQVMKSGKNAMDWDCTFIVNDVDKKNNVKVKPKVKLKLGNLFKSKKEKEEDQKKAEAAKPKKDNLFRSLFKKKDKDSSKKK